jgi:hypothetical protein
MISPCKPLRPYRPHPRHKRLPDTERMTIAIGFRSNDGVLICADTQLAVGDVKNYEGKVDLHVFYEKSNHTQYRLSFAIAGAGDVDYIATARAKLMAGFPECENDKEMAVELERRWLEFFNSHLAPWAYFPADDRPYVELLIGVSGTTVSHRLYHCVGTAFHETTEKAIGSGVILAGDMLSRYAIGTRSVRDNSVIATYIIAKVKRGAQHCGGSTHIMALRNGGDFAFSEKSDIDELEKDLLDNEKSADKELIRSFLMKNLPLSWMSEHKPKKTQKSISGAKPRQQ